jgi:hypothetical protein
MVWYFLVVGLSQMCTWLSEYLLFQLAELKLSFFGIVYGKGNDAVSTVPETVTIIFKVVFFPGRTLADKNFGLIRNAGSSPQGEEQ